MRAARGNILFLILLAVVLFAALTYAVTQGMRGGGNDASPEKNRAIAAEIINYATLMEQTVTRLRMTGGCDISQVSFENPVVSGYTNTTPSPADKHCHVFDPAGGGMSWKTPDLLWLEDQAIANTYAYGGGDYGTFNIPSTSCIYGIGTATCSNKAAEKDLMIGLKYLKKEVCDAINAQLGLTTLSVQNAGPAGSLSRFTGQFLDLSVGAGSNTDYKWTYCAATSRTGYTFYHVLMAR